ncbi:hypothetical protein PoB_007710400 [Plakobranchus ocellatus]|uniref:Uncharacterized protein n=1 Tax=Plakobranchus ocellatus TaxID=259542 RepID=A0AAV4E2Y0_9GAST|nr:hypothetical protein PoB_007710400 [Plakobranchus ocellatus]
MWFTCFSQVTSDSQACSSLWRGAAGRIAWKSINHLHSRGKDRREIANKSKDKERTEGNKIVKFGQYYNLNKLFQFIRSIFDFIVKIITELQYLLKYPVCWRSKTMTVSVTPTRP